MNSPAKILVVDDTPRNVKLLADLLSVKGYAVMTAESGRDALAKINEELPDLVLLDVVMPEMSGYEVCQKIRDNPATKMLPVVMVTALDPSGAIGFECVNETTHPMKKIFPLIGNELHSQKAFQEVCDRADSSV